MGPAGLSKVGKMMNECSISKLKLLNCNLTSEELTVFGKSAQGAKVRIYSQGKLFYHHIKDKAETGDIQEWCPTYSFNLNDKSLFCINRNHYRINQVKRRKVSFLSNSEGSSHLMNSQPICDRKLFYRSDLYMKVISKYSVLILLSEVYQECVRVMLSSHENTPNISQYKS